MFNKESFFQKLEKLHRELDDFISHSTKDCGPCIDCCMNITDSFLFVPLYVDYINHNLSMDKENSHPLMTWEEGYNITTCPYIDFNEKKCGIYNYRPAGCRNYPRLLGDKESSLYYKCVFYETWEFSDLDKTVPYLAEIERINGEINKLQVDYLKEQGNDIINRYRKIYENPLSDEKKLEQNMALYKSRLALHPDSVSLHYILAKNYFGAGRYGDSLKEIENVLNLDEEEARARILRAKIYERLNRIDEATEELKYTMEMHPKNSQACFILGIMYLMQEKYREAYNQFQLLLKINPYAGERYEQLPEYINLCELYMK